MTNGLKTLVTRRAGPEVRSVMGGRIERVQGGRTSAVPDEETLALWYELGRACAWGAGGGAPRAVFAGRTPWPCGTSSGGRTRRPGAADGGRGSSGSRRPARSGRWCCSPRPSSARRGLGLWRAGVRGGRGRRGAGGGAGAHRGRPGRGAGAALRADLRHDVGWASGARDPGGGGPALRRRGGLAGAGAGRGSGGGGAG